MNTLIVPPYKDLITLDAPHFQRREFRCKGYEEGKCGCGGAAPMDHRVPLGLEAVRRIMGVPIPVYSGFRCIVYNRTLNSNDESRHPMGMAGDIHVPSGRTLNQLFYAAHQVPYFGFGGIGLYDWGLHLDVDDTLGKPRRWDLRVKNTERIVDWDG